MSFFDICFYCVGDMDVVVVFWECCGLVKFWNDFC